MEPSNVNTHPAVTVTKALIDAIHENRLDEAEALLAELTALQPGSEELLVFPVVIAIQRGFVKEALQYINGLDEDRCPELKALCLNLLGDPTWHYHANRGLESEDAYVRKAMREMLGMVPEDETV